MTVAAIVATLNEADIIGENLDHLAAHGVDAVYVVDGGSHDGTVDICRARGAHVRIDTVVPFRQAQTMTALALHAGNCGHEWILPVDADEFWYATDGLTIVEALDGTRADKLFVPVWHHVDRNHRYPKPKLQKVAFRYQPGVTIEMGNHDCSIPGGTWGVLECRELQFRSFVHYCAKVAERLRTLDRSLPEGQAAHYRVLDGMTPSELATEWELLCAHETLFDPIPVRT